MDAGMVQAREAGSIDRLIDDGGKETRSMVL
jgi:hypothetical protein